MAREVRVLHFVSCMNRGGQETLIMNLYRNINRNKVQFLFLCSSHKKGDYDDEIATLGGKIYYLPILETTSNPFMKYYCYINILSKWLSDNRSVFDIVHLHTYHASDVLVHLEACRHANVKKIIVHSHNTQGEHVLFHKFCREVCKMYNFKHFACGERAAEWLYGRSVVNKGIVSIIKNGIITNKFRYNQEKAIKYRKSLGLDGKKVIGHVGRFEPQKNHFFLIDIFEQYLCINPNAVLILIGRGSLEQSVKERVNEKNIGDKVRFLGIRDDVPVLLSMMDIFLFPSLFEGLSVAAIEAQCNGLPMLTSDIPSMREARVTDLLHFISLEESAMVWAKEISEIITPTDRERYSGEVKGAGYDIAQSAANIEREYISYSDL